MDGTSICAKILQLFDSDQHPQGQTWALLEIDLKSEFNEALRQAAFDGIAGTASRAYDNGRVQAGDNLHSLNALWRFFGYFRAMHDTVSTLRHVDHKGQVHHVERTSGVQQDDPMEMIRFWCHNPSFLGPRDTGKRVLSLSIITDTSIASSKNACSYWPNGSWASMSKHCLQGGLRSSNSASASSTLGACHWQRLARSSGPSSMLSQD